MTQPLKIVIAQLNPTVGTINKPLAPLHIPPKPVMASTTEATQTPTHQNRRPSHAL